jgi:DNA repair protein RadC
MIRNPEDIHNLLGAEMSMATQEKLKVVLLNAKAEVIAVQEVYQGTVNSAQIRVAEILRPAVRENCSAIIIVHNHPSGDPTPSPEDILITRNIKQSAEMMDIEFNDHIIIGNRGFVSLKERMGW